MPGANEIDRSNIARGQRDYRCRTLLCGNARGKALFIINGYRERGTHRCVVAANHRVEVQRCGLLLQNRRTQNTTGMPNHERNRFWRCLTGSHNQVAFIFSIIIVHHHDHFAVADRS